MGHQRCAPTQGIMPGGWDTQGGGGYPTGPPPETIIAALVLSNAAIHTFAAAMQGVVTAGVGAALSTSYPAEPMRKVATLSLLHLRFVWVAGDGESPPIWEALIRGRGRMEGFATLNQALI